MGKARILHIVCLCAGLAAWCTWGAPHAMAQQAGTVMIWGTDFIFASGNNTNSNLPIEVVTSLNVPLSPVIATAAGFDITMALKADGTVWTWGSGGGVLGDGTDNQSSFPVEVVHVVNGLKVPLSGVIAITCGLQHGLALRADGTVWTWGQNNFDQLGNGLDTTSNVAVQVMTVVNGLNVPLTSVIAVASGAFHNLALKKGGTVWAWGNGANGQLGNGLNNNSATAVEVMTSLNAPLTHVIAIAGGALHSLALKADGKDSTVWAWGDNGFGELGNPNFASSNLPVEVLTSLNVPLKSVTAIGGGDASSMALTSAGTVWTWGIGLFGHLGNGTNNLVQIVPVPVVTGLNVPLSSVIAIASGLEHSAALKADGTVWTWGQNTDGELGNGTNTDSNVAVPASLGGAVSVGAGGKQTLAVISTVPFSAFAADLDIQTNAPGRVKLEGSFTLGAKSNGIFPLTEGVTVQAGGFTALIPGGSFKETVNGFTFEGPIGGAKTEASIALMGPNRYSYEIEVSVALATTATTVPVSLIIGHDSGSATVTPRIQK
jgi:alpha-tubulin suppressor-like RCC1 family protein